MTDLIIYITFFLLTLAVSLYLNRYLNRLSLAISLQIPSTKGRLTTTVTRSGGLSVFLTICVASAFAVATYTCLFHYAFFLVSSL